MNLLFSCIGRRGYIAEWFREHLAPGDRIFGTSNTEWTPGFHACDVGFIMPDVSSEGYVPALLELCRREKVDAILSFFDLDVDAIAHHRSCFIAEGVIPVVPDARVSEIGLDKLVTSEFLRTNDFVTPETFVDLESAQAALREGRIAWPVIVKPRFGFASQNLFLAHDEVQLAGCFHRAPQMLVQQHLSGLEHSMDVLNDLQGRVVSVVVKRKILMRAGETDQAVSVQHPAALELGERLGSALGNVGPLDVDFFIDGDSMVILELNPRFGGAYACSHIAGADFPRKILRMLRGEPVTPDIGRYAAGVCMMKSCSILPQYPSALIDFRRFAFADEEIPQVKGAGMG
jgi:carbamoyl-phosphate synthase large subunit